MTPVPPIPDSITTVALMRDASHIVLHYAPICEQALSSLDSAWSWPGLCLYGHGTFVAEEKFDVGLLKVRRAPSPHMIQARRD